MNDKLIKHTKELLTELRNNIRYSLPVPALSMDARITSILNQFDENFAPTKEAEPSGEEVQQDKSKSELIHAGIEFAKTVKSDSESYRSGAGFGYSCGLEAAQQFTTPVQPKSKIELQLGISALVDNLVNGYAHPFIVKNQLLELFYQPTNHVHPPHTEAWFEDVQDEFRMIISHALLGCDTSDVDKKTWDLVMSECAKYTLSIANKRPVAALPDAVAVLDWILEEKILPRDIN